MISVYTQVHFCFPASSSSHIPGLSSVRLSSSLIARRNEVSVAPTSEARYDGQVITQLAAYSGRASDEKVFSATPFAMVMQSCVIGKPRCRYERFGMLWTGTEARSLDSSTRR